MKNYLYNYIKEIDSLLEKDVVDDRIIENHLIKISFFAHERLIHLLVTLTYAIMFIISSIAAIYIPIFRLIVLIIIMFLIPYVRHYFKLENGVQYLYKQYDLLKEKK